jgi:hypothetical protein
MEARQGTEQRFIRLADAPGDALELDAVELLKRLEAQAAENGRLEAKVESLERAARAERDARRRLADTLKRERRAAEAIHARAEHDRAAHAAALEELERVRQNAAVTETHVEQAWSRLAEADRRLAGHERGFWRRLLRRPPRRA